MTNGNRAVPKLTVLPARDDMTVEEALGQVINECNAGEISGVVIIAVTKEDKIRIRSSKMSRMAANWLIDHAKRHALCLQFED